MYYVLVKPWGVYVKEAQFFIDQGGLLDEWGNSWQGPIAADDIEHARQLGAKLPVML